jgi:hypothetical protein
LTSPYEQALSVAEPQNMNSWSLCGRQDNRMADPAHLRVPFSPRSALARSRSISREIQIVSRDTIAAPMLSPKTTAPVHGGSNNKFLAIHPRTVFL